jgi:hypothetical protein
MADEYIQVPMIRMEEEEESGEDPQRHISGFAEGYAESKRALPPPSALTQQTQELIGKLVQERQAILADTQLKSKDKLKFLESNHRAILLLRGGRYKTFQTEQVVYAILCFSGLILVALALLNVFAGLPSEITLSFVGTTLGGTIATIAGKLGKL